METYATTRAQFDKLSTFPSFKLHNPEHLLNFSSAISGLVAVLKPLSFNNDLKGIQLLDSAVCKIPPNLKEACTMYTVSHN